MEFGRDCADARVLRFLVRRIAAVVTRPHPVSGGDVVAVVVVDRPDDAHAIHHRRMVRKEFAELNARQLRRDRIERTFVFFRRLRLWIVHIHVRWPAVEPEADDRLAVRGFARLGRDRITQSQPPDGECPDLEDIPARDSGTVTVSSTKTDFKHGLDLCWCAMTRSRNGVRFQSSPIQVGEKRRDTNDVSIRRQLELKS